MSRRKACTTITAVEQLKTLGSPNMRDVPMGVIRRFLEEKGFSLEASIALAETGHWAAHLSELVIRRPGENGADFNWFANAMPVTDPDNLPAYTGSHAQNRRIDNALANSGYRTSRQFLGCGAATYFSTEFAAPSFVRDVPVAVVGYGAAGIFATFALRKLGFRNVSVYERAKPLGVWSQSNVRGLSRNNPRRLEFYGLALEPAPGDGEEVGDFLERLSSRHTQANVTAIEARDMGHRLFFSDGSQKTFPIVINTVGLGKPKPLSDPMRMITTATAAQAGSRWQKNLNGQDVAGKTVALIGLGNSTAEMLQQIHSLIDQGVNVDYRVLTHYPEESVLNPNETVSVRGRDFRIFRDLSAPNLVDFQGDLPQARRDYYRALLGGKILHGVKRWEVEGKRLLAFRGDEEREEIPFDLLMTLIGYRNSVESLEALGCSCDSGDGCALFDYDGEFTRRCVSDPGRRIYKGYYGFGSVLESPQNPNAIVIPGMLHRIGDLLFGVIMRAAEYSLRPRP